jgi:hypothetical protein
MHLPGRHWSAIEVCAITSQTLGPGGGRPPTEYWLNEGHPPACDEVWHAGRKHLQHPESAQRRVRLKGLVRGNHPADRFQKLANALDVFLGTVRYPAAVRHAELHQCVAALLARAATRREISICHRTLGTPRPFRGPAAGRDPVSLRRSCAGHFLVAHAPYEQLSAELRRESKKKAQRGAGLPPFIIAPLNSVEGLSRRFLGKHRADITGRNYRRLGGVKFVALEKRYAFRGRYPKHQCRR